MCNTGKSFGQKMQGDGVQESDSIVLCIVYYIARKRDNQKFFLYLCRAKPRRTSLCQQEGNGNGDALYIEKTFANVFICDVLNSQFNQLSHGKAAADVHGYVLYCPAVSAHAAQKGKHIHIGVGFLRCLSLTVRQCEAEHVG